MGEAINTATYLRNRAPTKVLDDVTPYERWYGKQPSVSYFKTFGCDAVVLQKGPKPKGGKFLPKGAKMKFVGYQLHTKGYRLFNPSTRQIVIARDVVFFEQSFEKLSNENGDMNDMLFNLFKNAEDVQDDVGAVHDDVIADDDVVIADAPVMQVNAKKRILLYP